MAGATDDVIREMRVSVGTCRFKPARYSSHAPSRRSIFLTSLPGYCIRLTDTNISMGACSGNQLFSMTWGQMQFLRSSVYCLVGVVLTCVPEYGSILDSDDSKSSKMSQYIVFIFQVLDISTQE
jgi:hypothetical protein